jgi:methyltransferase
MTIGWPHLLIAFIVLERVIELVHARRNARALLDRGGRETGAGHYPLFFLLHGTWLATLAVLAGPDLPPNWGLLAALAVLQALRLWVILSLGPYWTTRVITVDGEPPVTSGPYRYLRHPNYVVVALEIPLVSLAVGLPWVALLFGCLNALLLLYRIRIEDAARTRAVTAIREPAR